MQNTSLKNKIEDQLIQSAYTIEGFEQLRSVSKGNLKFIELPNVKTEDWKYTNLLHFLENFAPDGNESDFKLSDSFSPNTIYIHNGSLIDAHFTTENSQWVSVMPIDQFTQLSSIKAIDSLSEKSSDYFVLLNNISFNRGAIIYIKSGASKVINLQIHYLWTNPSDIALSCRNIIYIEGGSKVHITETHRSDQHISKIFINQVTECYLESQSELVFNRMQELNKTVCSLNHTFSSLAAKARFEFNNIIGGEGIIRNNYVMNLNEVEAYVGLTGLNLLSADQHADSWVQMNHFSPNCNSDQLFKSIVNDQASSVFTGKIYVARGAQKTNAYQSCRSIVLNEKARAYARPQLEIYADDVKCSHGATTGQLNEEAIFYMQARGVSKSSAQRLMLTAFASDILSKIHDEAFCNQVESLIESKFSIG